MPTIYCKIVVISIKGGRLMTLTIIVIALIVIVLITALFLTAVNWGYQVKHTVDEITHESIEPSQEVKK